MKVQHKLKDGKLVHEILEAEPVKKALDTQTTGEGYEWIPEGYARRVKKKVRIHQVNLSEMKSLKRAKFLLRLITWKGQFVVRGMSVDHWDLVLDKGEKCLDEFAGMMNNPLEQPEGVNCIRRTYCDKTPEGKENKEWMKFYGKSIPPRHPEWGNPNRRIVADVIKVDEGSVNIISDTDTFVSFMFHGKELKGYWIAKRESPRAEIWVFSKSSLPGEPRKEIKQARHSREKCMECDKPPIYEVLWANRMGHAWFCEPHFTKWATEGDGRGDICSVKEIKEGEAAKKFRDNPNPNIWERLKQELSSEIP